MLTVAMVAIMYDFRDNILNGERARSGPKRVLELGEIIDLQGFGRDAETMTTLPRKIHQVCAGPSVSATKGSEGEMK
jgi:hypothetical protein